MITGKAVDFIVPLPHPRFEESGALLWHAILDATFLSSLIVVLPFLQTFYSESRAARPSVWSLKAEQVFWGEVALLNIFAHVARWGVLGLPSSAAFSTGNALFFSQAHQLVFHLRIRCRGDTVELLFVGFVLRRLGLVRHFSPFKARSRLTGRFCTELSSAITQAGSPLSNRQGPGRGWRGIAWSSSHSSWASLLAASADQSVGFRDWQ